MLTMIHLGAISVVLGLCYSSMCLANVLPDSKPAETPKNSSASSGLESAAAGYYYDKRYRSESNPYGYGYGLYTYGSGYKEPEYKAYKEPEYKAYKEPEYKKEYYNYVPQSCYGQAPGLFGNAADECKTFSMCQSDGRLDIMDCPAYLRFNNYLAVCDWPYKVDGSCNPLYKEDYDKSYERFYEKTYEKPYEKPHYSPEGRVYEKEKRSYASKAYYPSYGYGYPAYAKKFF